MVGRLQSGDIQVASVTEVEQDWLVAAADKWLPKLSDQLVLACSLSHRTYPILVHGMPSTFDTSINGEDVADITDSNDEFIEHPSVIQHVKFLPHKRTQAASRENRVLIIRFTDPTTANCCINCHIIFWGRLLPAVKYVHHPHNATAATRRATLLVPVGRSPAVASVWESTTHGPAEAQGRRAPLASSLY